MSNVNIPETEKIKLVHVYGHIRRREDNLSRKMMDMRSRVRPRRRWIDNTQEDMKKI